MTVVFLLIKTYRIQCQELTFVKGSDMDGLNAWAPVTIMALPNAGLCLSSLPGI